MTVVFHLPILCDGINVYATDVCALLHYTLFGTVLHLPT
jgi:hypothetical protein